MLDLTRPNSHLEGFRQLSSARVTRVHGDESHDGWPEGNLDVFKDEPFLAGSQCIQHSLQTSMA